MPAAWEPSDQVAAELRRVGVDYASVGPGRYLGVYELGDSVYVDAPPNEQPRRRWKGSEDVLLDRLAQLQDGAGVDACWASLDS
jgi:hypothetical protein